VTVGCSVFSTAIRQVRQVLQENAILMKLMLAKGLRCWHCPKEIGKQTAGAATVYLCLVPSSERLASLSCNFGQIGHPVSGKRPVNYVYIYIIIYIYEKMLFEHRLCK
jgi:hypothetical protein